MMYEINGKNKRIPDAEIEANMKGLGVTKEEAIQIWLEDNGELINEEQEALDKKASKVKIDHGATSQAVIDKKMAAGTPKEFKYDKAKEKTQKERVKKANDDKAAIIAILAEALGDFGVEALNIENAEKIVKFEMNGKKFTLNLVQNRK